MLAPLFHHISKCVSFAFGSEVTDLLSIDMASVFSLCYGARFALDPLRNDWRIRVRAVWLWKSLIDICEDQTYYLVGFSTVAQNAFKHWSGGLKNNIYSSRDWWQIGELGWNGLSPGHFWQRQGIKFNYYLKPAFLPPHYHAPLCY